KAVIGRGGFQTLPCNQQPIDSSRPTESAPAHRCAPARSRPAHNLARVECRKARPPQTTYPSVLARQLLGAGHNPAVSPVGSPQPANLSTRQRPVAGHWSYSSLTRIQAENPTGIDRLGNSGAHLPTSASHLD